MPASGSAWIRQVMLSGPNNPLSFRGRPATPARRSVAPPDRSLSVVGSMNFDFDGSGP